ncbi:MAG: hypothetical protein WC453_02685 [Patescibacteria group bacterium]
MKILLAFVKVAVVFLFIWNTGIFSYLTRGISKQEVYDPATTQKIRTFCVQRYQAAKAQIDAGGTYSLAEYFTDLSAIKKLQDSLHCHGGFNCGYGGINELWALSFAQSKDLSREEIDAAREKYLTYQPESLKSDPAFSWLKLLMTILHGLTTLYLKNLPWALLMMLIWLKEENAEQNKQLRLRSPLSFLISLILYPIFFTVVFIQKFKSIGRGFLAAASIQQTKEKFFSLLSPDELTAIRQFAKSNIKLQTFRQSLVAEGLVSRRSFALASLSLILCLFIINNSQASQNTKIPTKAPTITVLDVGSGNLDKPPNLNDEVPAQSFAVLTATPQYFVKEIGRIYEQRIMSLSTRIRKIEHIPILRLVNQSINYLLTKKGKENENYYFNIDSISYIYQ